MKNEALSKNIELYSLGDKAFKKGRLSEARKYFKLSLEACPDDYDAMWALGSCYYELGKPKKAEEWYRRAIALADEEDLPALRFNLGNSLLDQEKYQLAQDVYLEIPRTSDIWQATARNIELTIERLESEKSERVNQSYRQRKYTLGRGKRVFRENYAHRGIKR